MFGCLIERRAQCGAGGLLGPNYWEVWAVKSRETFYDSWNMQTLCLLTLLDTSSIQRTSEHLGWFLNQRKYFEILYKYTRQWMNVEAAKNKQFHCWTSRDRDVWILVCNNACQVTWKYTRSPIVISPMMRQIREKMKVRRRHLLETREPQHPRKEMVRLTRPAARME